MSKLSNRMLIIIIIICLSVIVFSIYYKKENTLPAFHEYDISKTYVIDLENKGITTRNMDIFIDDIISIYPDISKRYERIVDSGWYLIDNTKSIKANINILENYYKNIFNNNNLSNEYLNIELNGIVLKKIKIVADDISKYKDFSIKKTDN